MEYWFQGWKQARSCRQGYLIVKVEVYFVLPLMNHSIYAKQLVKGTLLSFFCIPPFLTHIYMSLFNEILPPPPANKRLRQLCPPPPRSEFKGLQERGTCEDEYSTQVSPQSTFSSIHVPSPLPPTARITTTNTSIHTAGTL